MQLAYLMFFFWKLMQSFHVHFHSFVGNAFHMLNNILQSTLYATLFSLSKYKNCCSDWCYLHPFGSNGLTACVTAQPGQHLRWTNQIAPIILLRPLLHPSAPEGPDTLILIVYRQCQLKFFGWSCSVLVLSQLASSISSCLQWWSQWSRYQRVYGFNTLKWCSHSAFAITLVLNNLVASQYNVFAAMPGEASESLYCDLEQETVFDGFGDNI